MIKLNAAFSKKVPAEQEYSSKSFLASVEVELAANASEQELRQKIHDTFELVKQSVEDEINAQATTRSSGTCSISSPSTPTKARTTFTASSLAGS